MANEKYYLDSEGLQLVINYIKEQLNTKLNTSEANDTYAQKEALNSLLSLDALSDYATKEYVRENSYDDSQILNKIKQLEYNSLKTFSYKGSVDTFDVLTQINDRSVGDTYHVIETDKNYSWSGFEWDDMGFIFDFNLENYYTKQEIEDNYLTQQEASNIYLPLEEASEEYLTKVFAANNYATKNELTDYYATKDEIAADYYALKTYADAKEYDDTALTNRVSSLEDAANNYSTTQEIENTYVKNNELNNLIRTTIYSMLSTGPVSTCTSSQDIQNALNSNNNEITIIMNNDANLSNININNKKVTFDLGEKDLTTSTAITISNNSDLVLTNGTLNNASNTVLMITSGSKAVLNNVNADSGSFCLEAMDGELTINSGYIQAQEGGILGAKNSIITLNNGKIECRDNCPFQGDGSAAGTNNDGTNAKFYLNNGTLIAHIQTPGYQACGAYIPNSGEFIMTGGQIISDGAGIVMRAGKVSLLGGEIICNIKTASGLTDGKGKVGNSRVVVPAVPIVYDAQANYPGLTYQDFELIIDMNNMIFRKGDGSGSLENLITLTDPEEIVTQLLGTNDEVIITNENGIYHIFMEQK